MVNLLKYQNVTKRHKNTAFCLTKRHNSASTPHPLRICSAPLIFVMFVAVKSIDPMAVAPHRDLFQNF